MITDPAVLIVSEWDTYGTKPLWRNVSLNSYKIRRTGRAHVDSLSDTPLGVT